MLKVAPAEIPEKTLNESPSEKEGKLTPPRSRPHTTTPQ